MFLEVEGGGVVSREEGGERRDEGRGTRDEGRGARVWTEARIWFV